MGFNTAKGKTRYVLCFAIPQLSALIRPKIVVPEKQSKVFQHFGRLFIPSPAVSMGYWSIIERNLEGEPDSEGSRFQRMANWPTFDFYIETV